MFGDIKLTNKPAIKEMERISDKEIAKLTNVNTISFFFNSVLIKLATPVSFSTKISPVCLPGGRQVQVGDKLIVTGWVSSPQLI